MACLACSAACELLCYTSIMPLYSQCILQAKTLTLVWAHGTLIVWDLKKNPSAMGQKESDEKGNGSPSCLCLTAELSARHEMISHITWWEEHHQGINSRPKIYRLIRIYKIYKRYITPEMPSGGLVGSKSGRFKGIVKCTCRALSKTISW